MGKAEKRSYRSEIIVALIGVSGVLGAAIISNWDKIFVGSDLEEPPQKRALREVVPLKTAAEKAWQDVQNFNRDVGFGKLLDDAKAALSNAQAFYDEKAYEQAIPCYKDVIAKCDNIRTLDQQRKTIVEQAWLKRVLRNKEQRVNLNRAI